jgi:hypothetical protein
MACVVAAKSCVGNERSVEESTSRLNGCFHLKIYLDMKHRIARGFDGQGATVLGRFWALHKSSKLNLIRIARPHARSNELLLSLWGWMAMPEPCW